MQINYFSSYPGLNQSERRTQGSTNQRGGQTKHTNWSEHKNLVNLLNYHPTVAHLLLIEASAPSALETNRRVAKTVRKQDDVMAISRSLHYCF